jgi:uridine kinase
MVSSKSICVGITGGTGSGKTTLAEAIADRLSSESVYIAQDAYYKDQSHIPFDQRFTINYEHPDAVDMSLLAEHLLALKEGKRINVPVFDYVTCTRKPETLSLEPCPVVLVDGLLILTEPTLHPLFDIKIYLDAPDDIRILRRVARDLEERGRTFPSLFEQYLRSIRPMHNELIDPSKKYADLILPGEQVKPLVIDMIVTQIEAMLENQSTI